MYELWKYNESVVEVEEGGIRSSVVARWPPWQQFELLVLYQGHDS